MHDLNSGFASLFNRRHRRVRSLFQGPFKAILVEDESHAWVLSRYVHLNPVRAGAARRPQDYRWSSYPAYLDSLRAPDWLDWKTVLQERSQNLSRARQAYREYVERDCQDRSRSPLSAAVGGMLLGSAEWVTRLKEQLADEPDDATVPDRRRLKWRPTAKQIVRAVARRFGVDPAAIGEVRRRQNDPRMAAIYLLRNWTDQGVTELARAYGPVSPSAISKLVRRAGSRRQEDPAWDRLLRQLEKDIQPRPASR